MERERMKRVLSASMLRRLDSDAGFVRHEWEELLEKMSCSDDPQLRAIGCQEFEALRSKLKIVESG